MLVNAVRLQNDYRNLSDKKSEQWAPLSPPTMQIFVLVVPLQRTHSLVLPCRSFERGRSDETSMVLLALRKKRIRKAPKIADMVRIPGHVNRDSGAM